MTQLEERVLDFWMGSVDADGMAAPSYVERWFKKDPAFDREIREQFESELEAVMAGQRENWLARPRGRLGYVILLDQLSRNMYRDQARMYDGDARALDAAQRGVALGHDRALRGHERLFLYMPFMHSESLEMQEECVRLFRAFRDEASAPLTKTLSNNLDYAIRHRDIVARFGRFPHRNALLGRTSTAEELAFLTGPGSSF